MDKTTQVMTQGRTPFDVPYITRTIYNLLIYLPTLLLSELLKLLMDKYNIRGSLAVVSCGGGKVLRM